VGKGTETPRNTNGLPFAKADVQNASKILTAYKGKNTACKTHTVGTKGNITKRRNTPQGEVIVIRLMETTNFTVTGLP